jgi:hypothetical protein
MLLTLYSSRGSFAVLDLLMVPTNTPAAGPGTDWPEDSPEEDFYLHLYLPPEVLLLTILNMKSTDVIDAV